jgi:ketosteroid isomerase-like protein
MTSPNIDRLMDGFRAMERGDVDAIVALADPEVEFVNPDTALEPGTRHGPEGLRVGLSGILEVFDEVTYDYDQVVDAGDRVVATGSFRGRGRASGMEVGPAPFAIVATLRDGRLVRFEWFATAEEALRAAGVPSES